MENDSEPVSILFVRSAIPAKDILNIKDMKKEKSNTQDFADTIRTNPQAIINWAKSEIAEHKKLIKILEKQLQNSNE